MTAPGNGTQLIPRITDFQLNLIRFGLFKLAFALRKRSSGNSR